ncbi:unnamed protein product [Ranitomeya imitator]|uniref:Uncharacterized protein n=1 Tax=Ranitomeya imitator TaxID=111125 RepID=A0ABN9KZ18_9NEOB|nr:unnamed protein product [Ranitomeya imitator]
MLASCHRRSGNYQKALDKYKEIHQKFPDNVECLRFLVRLCTDIGLKEVQEYTTKLKKAEKMKELKEQRVKSGRDGSARSRREGREGSASSASRRSQKVIQHFTRDIDNWQGLKDPAHVNIPVRIVIIR